MKEKEVRALIEKYVKGECTAEEQALLDKYLDSFQKDSEDWTDLQYDEEIKPGIWSRIQAETTSTPKAKQRFLSNSVMYKAAAVLAGIAISVALWLSSPSIEVNETLVIADDKIVFRSESGISELIELGEITDINDQRGEMIAHQEGGVIIFNTVSSIKKLIYSEVEVPRGKKIQLQLSDGTTVHLNANSTLKFPVNFLENEDRQVFLSGEGYFEVAKDEKRPFYVTTDEMSVRVVGTQFNVSSYAGSVTHTVLVEGSVAVQMREGNTLTGDEQVIVPGQKATMFLSGIEVKKVDVTDYVGWMYDVLSFDDEPFSEIIKKIERKYNVEITNQYKELAPVRFHGKFKEETVIDLLETFKASAGFTYHISENKIIINPK